MKNYKVVYKLSIEDLLVRKQRECPDNEYRCTGSKLCSYCDNCFRIFYNPDKEIIIQAKSKAEIKRTFDEKYKIHSITEVN